MFYDQVPQVPNKLRDFIMSLKDGATFTIPQIRRATGVSWHTCNNFIQKWPKRFRPSIIGRGKGLGRPFVYKLLSNGPGIVKPPATVQVGVRAKKYRMKRVVGGGSETGGAPEIWVKEEIKGPQLPAVAPTDEGWNRLPRVRKIRTLEALFPDGIKLEQYPKLFWVIELLEQLNSLVWNQEDT